MPRSMLFLALAAALPAAGQQSYDVSGDHVAIYNLAGTHVLQPARGNAVTVRVDARGSEAARLTVERAAIDGRAVLVVRYPDDRVVYDRGRGRGRFTSHVHVRSDGTFGDRDWTHDRRERGDDVVVRSTGAGLHAWADLTIGVPQGQRLSLYTAAGAITVTNVHGLLRLDGGATDVTADGTQGNLVVDIGSGDVQVRDAQGDVDIDTGSGSVGLRGLSGELLRVDTGSGSVRADAVRVGMLEIDTGSGSVIVAGGGARSIHIDTGSGGVELTLTDTPASIDIDTGSGGVTLTVPSDYGAAVTLETGSGGIAIDFPVQMNRWSRDHVIGTIGDGRGRLTVDTGSGSIRVVRGS